MVRAALLSALAIVIASGACGGGNGGATTGSGGSGGAGGGAGAGGSGGADGGRGGAGGSGGGAGSGGAGGGASGGAGGASAADGGADGPAMCGTRTDPNQGATCNDLTPTGPCVITSVSLGSPPAAEGGALQAGTYELASRVFYLSPDGGTTPAGNTRRETITIAGSGNSFTIQVAQLSGTMLTRVSGTLVTSGTQLTSAATCPQRDDGDGGLLTQTQGYTATATTFTLLEGLPQGTRVDRYMKR